MQISLISFARQYFQDNFFFTKKVLSHHAKIVIVFHQQEGITNMEQPVKSSHRNPIDYTWDKLMDAVYRMGDPR